jgi:hypothetical protein
MKMQNDMFESPEMTQIKFLREKKDRLHRELHAASEELETLLSPDACMPLNRGGDIVLNRINRHNYAIVEKHTYHVGPPSNATKNGGSEILCFVDIKSLYNAVIHFTKRTDS